MIWNDKPIKIELEKLDTTPTRFMKEKEKLYKPKTCSNCPAVRNDKGILICGCMKELKAKANNPIEKLQMWQKCPLAWDKE